MTIHFSLIITGTLISLAILMATLVMFFANKKPQLTQKQIKRILKEWKKIETIFPSNPMQGILQADKLFDYSLKCLGYKGGFANKLNSSKYLFNNTDSLWKAHKVRNKIAHEIGFTIKEKQARIHLKAFKTALRTLSVPL